ncbi:MAG: hypothetical protein M5T52_15620 [Ignavibacteriaceae bacterium]|nr:hypothetical protein [Ignavibacteriaceae bacterium]
MEFYKTLETINGMSNTIGTYELFFGDYKNSFQRPMITKKLLLMILKELLQNISLKKTGLLEYLIRRKNENEINAK